MAGRYTGTGVPAAAGYPQYSGNLISPVFSSAIQERFYCTSVFSEITDTSYFGEIARCGDTVQFFQEPDVHIQEYVKDGQLKHDTFETKPLVLTIDRAHAYSFKLDMIDDMQMCNSDEWVRMTLAGITRKMNLAIDHSILSTSYVEADAANRGANAGVCTGCYNLGEVGAPLNLTVANILDFMSNLSAVFDEQCIPAENRWIVVPPKFMDLVRRSELRSANFSGLNQSPLLNGRVGDTIGGIQIYVSNSLSRAVDPVTNEPVWNILAGWKGAIAFANKVMPAQRNDNNPDNFDIYYKGLMVWGAGVVRSDGIAHIYAKLT